MKKCPKCNKTYDDSWGICIGCGTKLEVLSDPQMTDKEKEFEGNLREKENKLKQEIEYAKKCSASKNKIITAFVIDLFVFAFIYMPLTLPIFAYSDNAIAAVLSSEIGFILFTIAVYGAYFILSEYIFGKTIGKAIIRLKVIVIDGTKPSLKTLFIRELNGWNPFFFYEKNSKTIVIDDRK